MTRGKHAKSVAGKRDAELAALQEELKSERRRLTDTEAARREAETVRDALIVETKRLKEQVTKGASDELAKVQGWNTEYQAEIRRLEYRIEEAKKRTISYLQRNQKMKLTLDDYGALAAVFGMNPHNFLRVLVGTEKQHSKRSRGISDRMPQQGYSDARDKGQLESASAEIMQAAYERVLEEIEQAGIPDGEVREMMLAALRKDVEVHF